MLEKRLHILVLSLLMVSLCHGQISEGGNPKSFAEVSIDESLVNTLTFDKPLIEQLLQEDVQRDHNGEILRDAVVVPINVDMIAEGQWFDIGNGDRLCRLKLKVAEALSLEAYYSQFYIPQGADFFVYNASGTQVLGAYTNRNVHETGRMSTDLVKGEVINFEYYEPSQVAGLGMIEILDLGYRYRDVSGLTVGSDFVQPCMVDVKCEEGQAWENQVKSSVKVRTRVNGQLFWNSATLMNNTALDCRPLLLTSLSSIIDGVDVSSTIDMSYYRFYFDHRALDCLGQSYSSPVSMVGAVQRAESNDDGGALGSDFLLLELVKPIPLSYDVFYAGWDLSTTSNSSGGVSIHYPGGGVAKISTYSEELISSPWGIVDTHWRVVWDQTTNGHGVRQGGSIGAGLFNQSGALIGTLTGGTSYCEDLLVGGSERPDFFGKLNYHWSSNPSPELQKLNHHLDPDNQGLQLLEGSALPCANGLRDNQAFEQIRLSPVPASSTIHCVLSTDPQSGLVLIIDQTGRIVLSEVIQQLTELDLSVASLADGLYTLVFQGPRTKYGAQRFSVQH